MRLIIIIFVFFASITTLSAEEVVHVAFAGDIKLDGYIGKKVKEHGFSYPFAKVKDIFDSADIVYGNLECSISRLGEPVDKKYTFRAEPDMVRVLKEAGFDLMDLANNHSGDYGKEAFVETMQILREQGISPVGAGMNISESRTPVFFKENGITVAFLSYSNTFPQSFWATKKEPGVTPAYLEYIITDVGSAKAKADIVIVAYHGGDERSDTPKQVQKEIAYTALDAGAAMVIGHHAHVLQGIELYKNRPIIYSLGNFLFLSKEKKCYDTMIVRARFNKQDIESLEIIPVRISDAFVRRAHTNESKRILDTLKTLSSDLNTKLTIKEDSAYVHIPF